MKILVLEPYHGGSHRQFLDGLEEALPFEFTRVTQPARGWKWRMRFSAPEFAERLKAAEHSSYDLILASTFLSLADFRGLAPKHIARLPALVYWHENQWAYPVRREDERDRHFVITNYTTALTADLNLFNSEWNKRSLMEGLAKVVNEIPDANLVATLEQIEASSCVIHPPIFEPKPGQENTLPRAMSPRILWNHRWEHDKNPDEFFKALFEMSEEGRPFELVVLGQPFKDSPRVFEEARARLASHIVHWGHIEERSDYEALLFECDLVVSTARHEFFGLSVLEAVLAGCRPLVPDHLSYPELYNDAFLYPAGQLAKHLAGALEMNQTQVPALRMPADQFLWHSQKPLWKKVLGDLAHS